MSQEPEFVATTDFFLTSEELGLVEEEAKKRGSGKDEDQISHKKARMTESGTAVSVDPSSFVDPNGRDHMQTDPCDRPDSDLPTANTNMRDSHNFDSTAQTTEKGGSATIVTMNNQHGDNINNEENFQAHNELDAITREAGLILDEKLQGVREWCKKLLQEITLYVRVTAKTQEEYMSIQRMEHQESDRLDTVEPDVKGATSHLLEPSFFGATPSVSETAHSHVDGNQT